MSNAAQNQHYVPKFILRNFLFDPKNEKVKVYDKHRDSIFTTSIKNIMAERRFHDLRVGDNIRSFEPASNEIEGFAIPTYRRLIETKQLALSAEERTAMSYFFAFQFVRTRASRDLWQTMAESLRDKMLAMGFEKDDIDGYVEPTDEEAKKQHLLGIVTYMQEFSPYFAEKNWQIMVAPPKRSFYISDNPVVLHNERQFGPYGNSGLGVPGVEIYLPLSSHVVLCAQCPSIVNKARSDWQERMAQSVADIGSMILSRSMTISQGLAARKKLDRLDEEAQMKLMALEDGGRIGASAENVDFINSLQTKFATRFVICQRGNFELARKFNREFPKFRTGMKPMIS